MSKKIWDFFTRRFEIFAILVNVVLIALSLELHAFTSALIIAAIAMVLGVLLVFDWQLKKHHDRSEMRRLHSEFIDSLLEAASKSISRVTGIDHMRACLMVKEGDSLRITNCYNFSEDDQDRGISILVGSGVAGKAWVKEQVVIADLRQRFMPLPPGEPDWSISQPEDLKVRRTLNSILSIPIKGGKPYRMLGVLNLDSDHVMSETRFFDKDIQHIAYCFHKALTDLLDETD